MSHLAPLPADHTPELVDKFATFEKILGFVPNSLLTMQRSPQIVKGFEALTNAVMNDSTSVDKGFKRLLAHFASRAAGCQYCEAHSLIAAEIHGVDHDKVKALWDYQTSDLYSDAERAALDFALAAGSVPNGVDDTIMDRMKQHWTEEQIVEILGAICLYGFLNRWNDSMATDLEAPAEAMGKEVLSSGGWDGKRHGVGAK